MISCKVLDSSSDPKAHGGIVDDEDYNMLWYCKADPRFQYWVRVPQCYMDDERREGYKLIVLIHGTGCETEQYMQAAMPFLEEAHAILMAPVFASGLFELRDYNSFKLLACDGIRYDELLLQMIDELKLRYEGIETDQFCICGHSGGGQFTNRFLLSHPERLKAACISAPGRPTYLDFNLDYFWGVRDFIKHFGHEPKLDEIRKVPVLMVVGSEDRKFVGESPYGTTRFERIHNLKKNFEENGIQVTLHVMEGADHGSIVNRSKRMNLFCDFFRDKL